MDHSLGSLLSRFLDCGFFRPLARPSASIYIDVAAKLIESTDMDYKLSDKDARVIIRDIISAHPDIHLADDEGGRLVDFNQKAAQFFNQLLDVKWIIQERINLDESHITITPALRTVLQMLSDISESRPEDLTDFASTLLGLCDDLIRNDSLNPNLLNSNGTLLKIKDFIKRAKTACDQIHRIENLILNHGQAQLSSESANDTLQRFLVDFNAGDHMVCYSTLKKTGLLPKINKASDIVLESSHNTLFMRRITEGIIDHERISEDNALLKAEKMMLNLYELISSIPAKQKLIDGRIASFCKLSASRYRYQTEMRGNRPEQIKEYMDKAADIHAGKSFADIENVTGISFLTTTVEFYSFNSLRKPSLKKQIVKQRVSIDESAYDPIDIKEEIHRHNQYILTPIRAARFVERILPNIGAIISTHELSILTPDELLDFLAALSFDRGPSYNSYKRTTWTVTTYNDGPTLNKTEVPYDRVANRLIERLTIERKS